jgi:AcrR family transcriptional regulator
MPRRNQLTEKRRTLLPIVARAFAELGYRRTTTAELARRCDVQENILYRLWPDKKAMFLAAIGYVYDLSVTIWQRVLGEHDDGHTAAERLLEYEARHHGEFGHYRLIFAGLSETDDPDIRAALVDMYRQYQRFLVRQIHAHRAQRGLDAGIDASWLAWAIIGLGTISSIGRELGLLSEHGRQRMFGAVGQRLLGDGPA